MPSRLRILVLGGGPDAEREVSIRSAAGIAAALRVSGGDGSPGASARFDVDLRTIDTVSSAELAGFEADVLFPYLHGPWGEGGPLQDLLVADGRPFVGSGSAASRLAMDKLATKGAALRLGIATPPFAVLSTRDPACALGFPVVVKPVHEGSTIGLHVCRDAGEYGSALSAIRAEQARGVVRPYMIEPKVGGAGRCREFTVGLIDNEPLPVIEIVPRDGLYDYEAKYLRDDTRYLVEGDGLTASRELLEEMKGNAARLCAELGVRHIARVDFLTDANDKAWLLEVNTTPGFTDHSLVPKAARACGITMPELCARLVDMAVRDHEHAKGGAGTHSGMQVGGGLGEQPSRHARRS